MISRNVAGQTKKSVVVAMHFIFWAAGNAIGPQLFLSWDAPRYFIAFSTHMGCYALLFVDLIILRWYLVRQNRQRDALAAAGVVEADPTNAVHGFEDLTDKANLRFRYMY